jgi:hypothetical protein
MNSSSDDDSFASPFSIACVLKPFLTSLEWSADLAANGGAYFARTKKEGTVKLSDIRPDCTSDPMFLIASVVFKFQKSAILRFKMGEPDLVSGSSAGL